MKAKKTKTEKIIEHFTKRPGASVKEVAAKYGAAVPMVYKLRKRADGFSKLEKMTEVDYLDAGASPPKPKQPGRWPVTRVNMAQASKQAIAASLPERQAREFERRLAHARQTLIDQGIFADPMAVAKAEIDSRPENIAKMREAQRILNRQVSGAAA